LKKVLITQVRLKNNAGQFALFQQVSQKLRKLTLQKIISPMFTGNGAYVIHQSLSEHIPDYQLVPFSPRWQYVPFALPYLFRQQAEIIHTTPDHAGFFRARCRKLFLTFQNFVLDDGMQQHSTLVQRLHYRTDLKWFTRDAINKADVITCVSRSTRDLMKNTLKYASDIDIIYNGVDVNLFTPAPDRTNNKEFRILFSGNLSRRKGAHLLSGIADKLNDNSIIYYTNGLNPRHNLPAHEKLRPLGAIRHDDIARIYRDMDVLLFPSFREGFSVAVLEAMATGMPVVTSDCSSMPEQIVEGSGGFLCAPGNVDDFAQKLNLLADSAALCRQMGEFNRARVVEKFSLVQMINGYQAVFDRLMN